MVANDCDWTWFTCIVTFIMWTFCLNHTALCPSPPNVPNAKVNYIAGISPPPKLDSAVTYSCMWSAGSLTTTCQGNGTWSPDPQSLQCQQDYKRSGKM
jgi:hypothetical protein